MGRRWRVHWKTDTSLRPLKGWTGLPNCAAPAVNIAELAAYMQSQGHTAAITAAAMTVDGQELLFDFLMACDFQSITPGNLRHDLCDGMQAQGFCQGGCM